MKTTILILSSFIAFNANSAEKNHHDHKSGEKHDHKDVTVETKNVGKGKVLVKVKGMVCSFCAQGVTRNFSKLKEVKSTQVNLDKMEVYLDLHPGKVLSEDVIKGVVTDAGFSYVSAQSE